MYKGARVFQQNVQGKALTSTDFLQKNECTWVEWGL